jgi:septal ring factor EnvC (AmiA/AmiB activator)
MQNDRTAPTPIPRRENNEKKGGLMALPATPSFSLAEANSIVEIEVQADQLLGYIDKLTTLADRACTTAIRQSQTAHLIDASRHGEINDLRKKLDQQNEKLHAQEIAIVRLQHESKAQIAAVEAQLRQNHLKARPEPEQHLLRYENAQPAKRLNDSPEIAASKVEPDDTRFDTANDPTIAELKLQIANRDETILAKTNALKATEEEYRARIAHLEQRLQETTALLEKHEEELNEKDRILEATASKEAEMGNLIKQLSAECTALSEELQKSDPATARGEAKPNPTVNEGTLWRRVLGRLQEEPQ